MNIHREWAMPNKKTFSIKPIRELIDKYIKNKNLVIVDPFSNDSKIGTITNDIDPECDSMFHMDATEFLCGIDDESVDVVLYDPPYSSRQISECYKKMNMSVNMETTQSSYWSKQKKEISRILKHGGIVITCSWNSNGIGKSNGMEILEILLVAHGGWHNDTIVLVEQKK